MHMRRPCRPRIVLFALAALWALAPHAIRGAPPATQTVTASPSPTPAPTSKLRTFNLGVNSEPTPAATGAQDPAESMRRLLSDVRKHVVLGPHISGPIFESWDAFDFSPAARGAFYGAPFYLRAQADYFFGYANRP
jgi:hypothetical protein